MIKIIISTLLLVLLAVNVVPEEEQEDLIGYEFLDDGKVVHIWNTQDHYYFNKSSGIQFTNHYQEYWSKNIFCIGYYNNDEWNKIKCTDELEGFNRDIKTDNETYVNATLWKDITYGEYDLRLGIQYHLGLDDENLSVTIYGKNLGMDIPFDLGFAWKVKDVEIPGLEEDYIDINLTSYALNGSYDLTFKNMNESYFNIHDITKYLRMDWNENLNYAIKMYGNGNQEDFYVTLLINVGHFNPNQEKSTTFYWIDADIKVDLNVNGLLSYFSTPRSLVWTDKNTGYVFFSDNAYQFHYRKTTDAGASWGTEVAIMTGTVWKYAIWYDRWTKDDTGNIIHITFMDAENDNITYNSLDTSDDSLGGEVTVLDGVSLDEESWNGNVVSIVKARGGNVYVGGWIDSSGEKGFWRATDSPATSFTSRNDMADGNAVDRIMFLAGNEIDSNDIWSIYQDIDADEITLKVYDDSENSWNESDVIDSIIEEAAESRWHYDCMERHSDGNAILVLWNEDTSATGDLAVWNISNSSTFTAKTDVVSDSAVYGIAGMMINQQNDDLYVAYTTGTTAGAIVYKKSTDGGDIWGDATAMSVTSDRHNLIIGGTSVGDDGGRWMPIWFNDDLNDLVINSDNSIEISVVVPPDTCSCPASGDWNVACSDSCHITTECDLGGTNLALDGTGNFTIDNDILNIKNLTIDINCDFIKGTGNFTIIKN